MRIWARQLFPSLARERPAVVILVHDRRRRRDLARVLHGGLAALRSTVPPVPGLRLCLLAQEPPYPEAECPGSALYWSATDGQTFVLLRLYLRAGGQPRTADDLLAILAELYLEAAGALSGQPVVLAAQKPEDPLADDPLLRQPGDALGRLRKAA